MLSLNRLEGANIGVSRVIALIGLAGLLVLALVILVTAGIAGAIAVSGFFFLLLGLAIVAAVRTN